MGEIGRDWEGLGEIGRETNKWIWNQIDSERQREGEGEGEGERERDREREIERETERQRDRVTERGKE